MSKSSPSGSTSNSDAADSTTDTPTEPRRNFIYEFASIVIGGVVATVPLVIGGVAFLNPLTRKRRVPDFYADPADTDEGMFRICSLDALTEGGPPQRFAVIGDQIDAWNFTPDQSIGSVYIQRLADNELRVFNTTCPHAGCSVSCDGNTYNCPCHNSAFNLDGSKLDADTGRANPSPRPLDDLKYTIEDDAVMVEFENYFTGREHKKAKQ